MNLNLKFVRRVNSLIIGSLSATYIAGKILKAKKLRNHLELKEDDKVVPVPPKLKNLIENVVNDLNLDEKSMIEFEPFISTYIDVEHYGVSAFGYKSLLGIPRHFLSESAEDADFKVMVNNEEISNNSPDYNYLKLHLHLSEEAKKFAIAHQIYKLQYSDIFIGGVLPLLIVVNCNIISFFMQRFFSKGYHPQSHIYHGFVYVMGIWLYFLILDIFFLLRDLNSDLIISDLGQSYVNGGVEYYEKMLKRNRLLKKLDSSLPIREDGELKWSFFRIFNVPISKKIANLKDSNSEAKKSIWNYVI